MLSLLSLVVGALLLSGCMTVAPDSGYAPDYMMVTAIAPYKAVADPGTQKKVAQRDAEQLARTELMNRIGELPVGNGEKIADRIARNPRMRADVLAIIRTAELVDWEVWPECNVRVWMRVDVNRVREAIAACR